MTSFIVKIKKGELDFGSDFNLARFRQFSKEHEGEYMRLEKPTPIRSLSQNNLYWAWLAKVEMETGNAADDLHEYLKIKFLPKRIIRIKGKNTFHELASVGSTTNITKIEFGEYLDKCSAHTEIPLPTEAEIIEMGYLRD